MLQGGVTLEKRRLRLAVIGGVLFAADLAFYNSAVMLGSATSATLMTNNAPLIVGLGSWLILKQKPGRAFWLGLALATAGTAVVAGTEAMQALAAGWANALALLSAVFYAGYILVTGRVRAHSDTLTLTSISVFASAASLLLYCLVMRLPLSGYSLKSWAALAGIGLVTQLGGYLAISYALGHLPATVTSVSLLAQLPVTALLAVPCLGEPISTAQIAGGVLVLGGIYLATRE
jgi:drug/metabolite transporter (DMT)-like permease